MTEAIFGKKKFDMHLYLYLADVQGRRETLFTGARVEICCAQGRTYHWA